MYARGVLFGKMKYELGDHAYVRCPELGLVADIEFKTKGYFSGKDDAIGGFIQEMKSGKHLFELSGFWNGEMHAKEVSVSRHRYLAMRMALETDPSQTGQSTLLFDAKHARETYPSARPLEEQSENESQRLWRGVTEALKKRDHNVATDEKSRIEDAQRAEAAKRPGGEENWTPRLFTKYQPGLGGLGPDEQDIDFILDANIDGKTAQEQVEQILAVAPILPQAELGNGRQPSAAATSTAAAAATAPAAAHQPSRAQLEQALLERKDSTTGNVDTFVDASS